MKRSEATRYARWSAVLALVLSGLTGALYLQRQWVAHVEKRNAPPAPPVDVERQSSALTFSKVEGNRTIFTVRASKSTEFKGQDASLLEDVTVTVFGKNGDRHDVIHTQSCRYARTDGGIQCNGPVKMELQSAADAERVQRDPNAAPNIVRIDTSGVTFERSTGRAQTVQNVKFSFPNGSGEGVGAVYFSTEAHLQLVKDVRLKLHPSDVKSSQPNKLSPTTDVDLRGSSLDFEKNARKILLTGPVTATTTAQQLNSGELTLFLDEASRAQTLVATPGPQRERPEVISQGTKGKTKLRAEKLTCNLAPEGWIRSVQAEGGVTGNSDTDSLQAQNADLQLFPQVNQAKLLNLRGNVQLQSVDAKAGTTRHVTTNAMELVFAGGKAGQASHAQHAETLERGSMEWTDSTGSRSKVDADKLAMDFGAGGKAQQLVATGSVQTEREIKGRPLQTASAASGNVQMDAKGQWSQITLRGSVRMKEADRKAESQQAVFAREAQTAILTGQASVRDSSSETHAPKITFWQSTGAIEAEGGVRSTDFSMKNGAAQFSQAPANLSSEKMKGNSKTGRAFYSGHARLWQGASVLEGDSIELQRDTQMLIATGNVRAVFEQAPGPQETGQGKTPVVWHVSAGSLTYWDKENRAHLEKDVVAQSAVQKMRSAALELYFTRQSTAAPGGAGPSQISRAVGAGDVMVEEGDRRGTAERGVYTAEDQKFVLSGGNPTLYDANEGTTVGRELTFYIADDTIIVDSGNGLRTLTRHRVQR
jgi:lipopolysaccharide export system protein LptA